MPRQPANGQPQDATFVAHTGVNQPITQIRFARGDCLLQFMDSPRRRRVTFAPLWAGRVQVENRQTRVTALGFTCREETAAVSERQQIADLSTLPGTIGDACRQHLIKQKATRSGEQARTHIALFRQGFARSPGTGVDDVAAVMPETLGAEIIGNTLPGDQLQTLFDRGLVASELSQAQREAVGRMGTALQLASVPTGLENLQR